MLAVTTRGVTWSPLERLVAIVSSSGFTPTSWEDEDGHVKGVRQKVYGVLTWWSLCGEPTWRVLYSWFRNCLLQQAPSSVLELCPSYSFTAQRS